MTVLGYFFSLLVIAVYTSASLCLLFYGLNCYVMIALFARRWRSASNAGLDIRKKLGRQWYKKNLPVVTTQIAIFNEVNVVERVVKAACNMIYPKDKHEIQILDDSTDETTNIAEAVAKDYRARGYDVKVIHRDDRKGFKAGALQEGLQKARGELVTIFDADFVPPPRYLMAMVPFFMADEKVGLVQSRWGHLNRKHSLLTRVQSIGIDGHFIIEQVARCWNNLFMNFNGTAGMWRKKAIESGGGWKSDTLTEDLDLSYRVQFAGWKTVYLPRLVVPAELPEDINALRGQQFRWAKGSVQTLVKLFPTLAKSDYPLFKKIQAIFHMGGYLVHPLMLILAVFAAPMYLISVYLFSVPKWLFAIYAFPLFFAIIGPSLMYFISQMICCKVWYRRLFMLPILVVVGVGFALSNTVAIVEALYSKGGEFVRTPKRGGSEVKRYRVKFPWTATFEIALGIGLAVFVSICCNKLSVFDITFLFIYSAGFLFMGLLSLVHVVEMILPKIEWNIFKSASDTDAQSA